MESVFLQMTHLVVVNLQTQLHFKKLLMYWTAAATAGCQYVINKDINCGAGYCPHGGTIILLLHAEKCLITDKQTAEVI